MAKPQTLIALAVQHLLTESGSTAEELAAVIGAVPSDLSARLSGEAPIEDRDVPRLAEGLGVAPDELIAMAGALGAASSSNAVRARLGLQGHPTKPHGVSFFDALIADATSRVADE